MFTLGIDEPGEEHFAQAQYLNLRPNYGIAHAQ
jgi:hypothetical protein